MPWNSAQLAAHNGAACKCRAEASPTGAATIQSKLAGRCKEVQAQAHFLAYGVLAPASFSASASPHLNATQGVRFIYYSWELRWSLMAVVIGMVHEEQ